ncbi:hypothetical protein KVR01_011724 [Diaporthe batatas]|uniref:uncharacterized protein n=1 Tax=Diaporthe batatas TaxID=748121 RepID=UPI001D04E72F|nr:uncharacterized protein KVR01_011724 [Diaporthe batatas]KAG8158602.1 hypothetical protein KVR01_011724 [Diaporthe batatas]
MGAITTQVLHLSNATSLHHGPSLATQIITAKNPKNEDEFHEHDGLLRIPRIFEGDNENLAIKHHLFDSVREATVMPEEALRLTVGKPGLLDTLDYVEDDRLLSDLASHEIEVQVKATGINFRDIMAAMGLIPMTVLGLEGSGIVTKVGSQAASHFGVGDRVSFMGLGAHATRCRTDYRLAVKIPDSTTFPEAAALPIVYITAYHALVNQSRLRKGESALIHAAAGGVWQAAIQVAQRLGLVIYTTVGSQKKRKLLTDTYGIPEEHIFYSRDASFAKDIMRVTGGRGVDCVLNSLSGELLKASWECLAPFGTMIEIGLRDILDKEYLDMRPFAKGTTFTFLDTFGLLKEKPDYLGGDLKDAFYFIRENSLQAPTPLSVQPFGKAGDTFRTVQQGRHRGKMVPSFEDDGPAPVLRRAQDSLRLNPDATYLLVGGLGGLGRSLARHFVECGARNIAFISRSGGETPEAQALIRELSVARVRALKGDATDAASFRAAINQCESELPAVGGVVQMAMVLRDTVFETMSYDAWNTGLRPKVQGTMNIHDCFGPERPLEFFLMCSSVSGVTGNMGQAQYCAGNTYQDTLAHYRRSKGLKATSINLGIMRDVGVIAEQGVTGHYKIWEEALGIREPTFHALIKGIISRQMNEDPAAWPPAQVITGLGTAEMMTALGFQQPWYFSKARFEPLAVTSPSERTSGSGSAGASSVASRLAEADSKERAVEIITEALTGKVADILQMPPSDVDPERPMYRCGVDSLVALEVRNWISKEMKASVALLEVLAAVPMTVFAATIADKSEIFQSAKA